MSAITDSPDEVDGMNNDQLVAAMLRAKNERRRAESDVQLLANRLAHLKAEEEKARRKIDEVQLLFVVSSFITTKTHISFLLFACFPLISFILLFVVLWLLFLFVVSFLIVGSFYNYCYCVYILYQLMHT